MSDVSVGHEMVLSSSGGGDSSSGDVFCLYNMYSL